MTLAFRTKRELKRLNEIKDKGVKISYLMDILGKKNQELRFLKIKILELKRQVPGQLDICKTCAAKKLFDESLK